MRKWLIPIIVVIVLSGCGPVEDQEPTVETPETTPEPATPLVTMPALVPTLEAAYPPPTTTPEPEDYPAPADTDEPVDPYPAGLAPLLLPAGDQCEEKRYPDLNAALEPLESAGVEVMAATTVDLIVCAACGCPTSEHYRIQIDPADLDIALALGWRRE